MVQLAFSGRKHEGPDNREVSMTEWGAKQGDGFQSRQSHKLESTKTELILVANARAAVLFRRNGSRMTPRPLALMEHVGASSQAASAHACPVKQEVLQYGLDMEAAPRAEFGASPEFAGRLAQRVELEMRNGQFDGVTLFAASPFLGDLVARLGPRTVAALSAAFDVDLTRFSVGEMAYRAGTLPGAPPLGIQQTRV